MSVDILSNVDPNPDSVNSVYCVTFDRGTGIVNVVVLYHINVVFKVLLMVVTCAYRLVYPTFPILVLTVSTYACKLVVPTLPILVLTSPKV